MKSAYYVATVTGAYRRRIDALLNGSASPEQTAALQRELNAVSHRAYASGFYFGEMKKHVPDDGSYAQDCTFVGIVREVLPGGRMRVEQRNRICAGDLIEVLSPHSLGMCFTADHMADLRVIRNKLQNFFSLYRKRSGHAVTAYRNQVIALFLNHIRRQRIVLQFRVTSVRIQPHYRQLIQIKRIAHKYRVAGVHRRDRNQSLFRSLCSFRRNCAQYHSQYK
jgi:hypothetical protein